MEWTQQKKNAIVKILVEDYERNSLSAYAAIQEFEDVTDIAYLEDTPAKALASEIYWYTLGDNVIRGYN